MDEPIVWYEGADLAAPRYLHANHQGSVTAVTDATGAVLGVNSYDPYGVPGQSHMGRFGYTGQMLLPEVGLWHYKARICSATLGRFLQTDPVGYADQMTSMPMSETIR